MKLNRLLSPPRFETGNESKDLKWLLFTTLESASLYDPEPAHSTLVFHSQRVSMERKWKWNTECRNEVQRPCEWLQIPTPYLSRVGTVGCLGLPGAQLLQLAETQTLLTRHGLLRLAVSVGPVGGSSLFKEASMCRSSILRHTEFHFIGGRQERNKGRIEPFFLVLFLLPFAKLIQVLPPKSGLLGRQMRGGRRQ